MTYYGKLVGDPGNTLRLPINASAEQVSILRRAERFIESMERGPAHLPPGVDSKVLELIESKFAGRYRRWSDGDTVRYGRSAEAPEGHDRTPTPEVAGGAAEIERAPIAGIAFFPGPGCDEAQGGVAGGSAQPSSYDPPSVVTSQVPGEQVTAEFPPIPDDARCHAIADEIEHDHPGWIVLWVPPSHEYLAFRLSDAVELRDSDDHRLREQIGQIEEMHTHERRPGNGARLAPPGVAGAACSAGGPPATSAPQPASGPGPAGGPPGLWRPPPAPPPGPA